MIPDRIVERRLRERENQDPLSHFSLLCLFNRVLELWVRGSLSLWKSLAILRKAFLRNHMRRECYLTVTDTSRLHSLNKRVEEFPLKCVSNQENRFHRQSKTERGHTFIRWIRCLIRSYRKLKRAKKSSRTSIAKKGKSLPKSHSSACQIPQCWLFLFFCPIKKVRRLALQPAWKSILQSSQEIHSRRSRVLELYHRWHGRIWSSCHDQLHPQPNWKKWVSLNYSMRSVFWNKKYSYSLMTLSRVVLTHCLLSGLGNVACIW